MLLAIRPNVETFGYYRKSLRDLSDREWCEVRKLSESWTRISTKLTTKLEDKVLGKAGMIEDQTTVPLGTIPFLGITTMPSRI